MKRVEIFVNQSIAEDLQDHLKEAGLLEASTRWTPVYGTGHAGPREGSAIWPETNSALLLMIKKKQLEPLRQIIAALKKVYPREGLKCYISAGPEEVL